MRSSRLNYIELQLLAASLRAATEYKGTAAKASEFLEHLFGRLGDLLLSVRLGFVRATIFFG